MRTFEVSYFVPSVTTKGFQEAEMLTAHDGLCASITNYDFNVYFWDEKLGKQKENYPNFLKIPINMFFLLKRGVWERGGGMLARLANEQPESTTFAPYSAAEKQNSTADCYTATEPLH